MGTDFKGLISVLKRYDVKEVDGGYTSPCWVSGTISLNSNGYAAVYIKGKLTYLHRLTLSQHLGRELTSGYHVDHLCHNRACCRVSHLREVTPRENHLNSDAPNIVAYLTNRCAKGLHDLTGDNISYRNDGRRRCKACDRERRLKNYAANYETIREEYNAYRRERYRRLKQVKESQS